MSATAAQLGARALRKLGVAIVADAARPAAGATLSAAQLAGRVLRELGLPVAEVDRPAVLGTVAAPEIAKRALRSVGVNPLTADPGAGTGLVYDRVALATACLLKLAVIASDEAPSDADLAYMVARVVDVHDQLVGADYVDWTVDAVPAALAEPYIILASNMAAPAFGKPANLDAVTSAQAMIRMQALTGTNGQALAEAKVAAVHDELNAAGVVSWLLSAVPIAHAERYVQMVVVQLASTYKTVTPDDRKTDAEIYGAAVEAIRRAGQIKGAQTRAAERIAAVHEELNSMGLVTWGADAVPASMADAYTTMAAAMMGAEGGKPLDGPAYAAQMSRIRLIAMGGRAGQLLAEQKVKAVQYSLEARGRARWTLYMIPAWAEEPLVLKAATLLAPEVGQKADPAWEVQAEAELMRIASLPSVFEPVQAVYF